MTWLNHIHVGDCRALMRQMIADGVKVNSICTSPPYWGLRDYGVIGQFGLEPTWQRHVARIRYTLRLARDLLARDGTLWLNYGDSYISWRPHGSVGNNSKINGQESQKEFRKASRAMNSSRNRATAVDGPNRRRQRGLKDKDLVGMPWRVALALQDDGWWLRSDIIWHKPNPMPESTRDRPTKSHEYVFMLAKNREYYFNQSAVMEDISPDTHARMSAAGEAEVAAARGMPAIGVAPGQPKSRPQGPKPVAGWDNREGSHSTLEHAKLKGEQRADDGLKDPTKFGRKPGWRKAAEPGTGPKSNTSMNEALALRVEKRNIRTVWKIPTEGFSAAHFATFPRELVRRCILAGSRPGDTVFDPFMRSGTVAEVALDLGRNYIGCELNPEYAAMFKQHRSQQVGLGV